MLPLIRLIVFITSITIHNTKVIDNVVRKWFGKSKVTKRKGFLTKYELWVKLLILFLYAVLAYLIGLESSYIYILIVLYFVTFSGFEAILEKKYIKNSNDYIFTFSAGLLKSLLIMILIVIYNLASY